jgi:hypothetical protein
MNTLGLIAAKANASLPNHVVKVDPPEPGYDGNVFVYSEAGNGRPLDVRIQGTGQRAHLVVAGGGDRGCCLRSHIAKTKPSVDILAESLVRLVVARTKAQRRDIVQDANEAMVAAGHVVLTRK